MSEVTSTDQAQEVAGAGPGETVDSGQSREVVAPGLVVKVPAAQPAPDRARARTAVAVPVPAATWGWRGGVARATLGVVRPSASGAEQKFLADVRTIRQGTWTRAVNVVVAQEKGGQGKTPAALVLGGVLGSVRGGYVAVWEATENRGYLCERGEGEPPRGLAELLRGAGAVNSAGTLGGFTAPQTSHADVIGSVGAREELTAEDVVRIRQVLDRYYRITVTDTGNNHLAGAYVAAVATADAVLIPVTPTPSSIEGALRTLVRIRDLTADSTHLDQRVVAMITHPGGLEIPSVVAELPEALREYGAEVVEVPYDVELRRDGEITLDRLTQEFRRAWTAVAARVVEKLLNAPETLLVRV